MHTTPTSHTTRVEYLQLQGFVRPFNQNLTIPCDPLAVEVSYFGESMLCSYRITSCLIINNTGEGSRDIFTPTLDVVYVGFSLPHVSV